MHTIVQQGNPTLRERAEAVPIGEIRSDHIQGVIRAMQETLRNEPEGAALAAPQIGVSLRIFVIAERVFGPDSDHPESSKDPHLVFINPRIVRRSKRRKLLDEGCLSVRGRYGTIHRHTHATVEAYDEHGKKFVRGAGGLLAQAFQHECDHLDGTLFVDKATEVWEVERRENERSSR